LAGSLWVCASILDVLENNRWYGNESPYCEPQLGRRDLYRTTGSETGGEEIMARLWVLNLSDGKHSLLDIAEQSGISFPTISEAADLLCQKGLLSVIPDDGGERTARGEAAREDNSQRLYRAPLDRRP
jgi:aminopeptidase-like protein